MGGAGTRPLTAPTNSSGARSQFTAWKFFPSTMHFSGREATFSSSRGSFL